MIGTNKLKSKRMLRIKKFLTGFPGLMQRPSIKGKDLFANINHQVLTPNDFTNFKMVYGNSLFSYYNNHNNNMAPLPQPPTASKKGPRKPVPQGPSGREPVRNSG